MIYLALTKYYCCSNNNKTILWKWYFDQQAQEQMFKFEISGMGVIGRFTQVIGKPDNKLYTKERFWDWTLNSCDVTLERSQQKAS